MKEQIEALKARVKVCAQASKAKTAERHKLKGTHPDKQSGEYQSAMQTLFFERLGTRWEGRVAHLAYGFARGVPYRAMESQTQEGFPFRAIAELLGIEDELVILNWMNTAAETEAAA